MNKEVGRRNGIEIKEKAEKENETQHLPLFGGRASFVCPFLPFFRLSIIFVLHPIRCCCCLFPRAGKPTGEIPRNPSFQHVQNSSKGQFRRGSAT